MIATRFVPVICAMVGVALVPTLIHSYGSNNDAMTSRVTEVIPTTLASYSGTPTDRHQTWGRRRFETDDWFERNYTDAAGQTVRLTVVRTFDAKTVYHHPELAVAYGTGFVGEAIVRGGGRPDVPVHVLEPGEGVLSRASYVLYYDGRFVENPVMFQIRAAVEMLFSRRQPMTLVFAYADTPRPKSDGESAVHDVLLAAVKALEQSGAAQ
jgi:hypothetical protein